VTALPSQQQITSQLLSFCSPDEIMADFKSFYYETALSAHAVTLTAMEAFVSPERIIFGTDFPGGCCIHLLLRSRPFFSLAVSSEMAGWYTKNLVQFHAEDDAKLSAVMAANALELFPRFQNEHPII
jgi:predicted TIM-barrel fold metal-dependent hydrolase